MYYALLIICLASDSICEVENAVYADQSSPIFDDEKECHAAAIERLHSMSFEESRLKENVRYQINVICEKVDDPA